MIVVFILSHTYHCVACFPFWTQRWQTFESYPGSLRFLSLLHTKSEKYHSGQLPSPAVQSSLCVVAALRIGEYINQNVMRETDTFMKSGCNTNCDMTSSFKKWGGKPSLTFISVLTLLWENVQGTYALQGLSAILNVCVMLKS